MMYSRDKREVWSLFWPNDCCNCIVFDLFDFFYYKHSGQVSEAEQAGGRRERRHQREEKYFIFSPS